MGIIEVGCCGAYCGTCKVFKNSLCAGCKIGYIDGERDINKAKCKMKVCCVKKNYNSCADCCDYTSCQILNEFYSKSGYKYKKYKQATEFIRQNGYESFLKTTKDWSNVYGKYS